MKNEEASKMKNQKRSKILFVAALIATACLVYIISYMGNADASNTGTAIAMTLATPSVIASGIGTLLAWLGFFSRGRGFALGAAIVFCVAMFMMIPWFMFNVAQAVLCFIAFATMKKK